MMADLLAGPLAWGLIGWGLDRWLGTTPWLLAVGLVVGWAMGIYLVWLRHSREADAAAQARQQAVGSTPASEATTEDTARASR